MGLGKTIEAMSLVHFAYRQGLQETGEVVIPPRLTIVCIPPTYPSIGVLPKGFESCYGIIIYQYKKSFHDAPAEVLDALDKRMNLNKIRFWQESQDTRARGQLIQISSQIIDE
jgi:hypothetical protein